MYEHIRRNPVGRVRNEVYIAKDFIWTVGENQ